MATEFLPVAITKYPYKTRAYDPFNFPLCHYYPL